MRVNRVHLRLQEIVKTQTQASNAKGELQGSKYVGGMTRRGEEGWEEGWQ